MRLSYNSKEMIHDAIIQNYYIFQRCDGSPELLKTLVNIAAEKLPKSVSKTLISAYILDRLRNPEPFQATND